MNDECLAHITRTDLTGVYFRLYVEVVDKKTLSDFVPTKYGQWISWDEYESLIAQGKIRPPPERSICGKTFRLTV